MRATILCCALAGLVFATGCGDDGLLDPGATTAAGTAGRADATGQSLVVAGAGLLVQPSALNVNVPVASSGDIVSATLYWAGRGDSPDGDPAIELDGAPVLGEVVAAIGTGEAEPWLTFHRLDVRDRIVPGAQSIVVSGFDPGGTRRGGIALAVVYRDAASPFARIRTIEPSEYVHGGTTGADVGAVWSLPLRPLDEPRFATLTLVAADCESGLPDRVWWSAEPGDAPAGDLPGRASGSFSNLLRSAYGPWLDVVTRPFLVLPPGAGHFAWQVESPIGGDRILHLFGAVGITGDVPCEAAIGDLAWRDDDGDGVQDAGEPGLAGVAVTLRDAAGALLATTVSDSAGAWRFDGLCAGDYLVEAAPPAGHEPSPCDAGGDDGLDSECAPVAVTLADDAAIANGIDFGFVPVPEPGGGLPCLKGPGFWWTDLAKVTGTRRGRPHFDREGLESLVARAEARTAVDWDGDGDALDLDEARDVLDPRGPSSECAKAYRFALAMLLDWALSGEDDSLDVDTDGDGAVDATFGEAIDRVEALLLAAATDGEPACRAARALAAAVLAGPDGECAD